jgi:sortase A
VVRYLKADRKRAGIVALVAVVLATGLTFVGARVWASDPAEAVVDQPTAEVTFPPTTRRTRATTTTTAELPTPALVPEDPYAYEPEIRLGTIEIPRLGLADTLYQGVTLTSIDRGPSHWPGTALPGELGNAVVAGHRVTRTHPFRHLDQMQPGDEVIFTVAGERSVYEMTRSEVVTPDGMHIVDQRPEHTATLFACHPPGSARFRYVVHLRQVDPPPEAR